jgi:hypothetical protein
MAYEALVVDEIASLLDQCSPDELADILQGIDGLGADSAVEERLVGDETRSQLQAFSAADTSAASAASAPPVDVYPEPSSPQAPLSPVPPAGQRPAGGGRPFRRSVSGNDQDQQITLSEAKTLLNDHRGAVVSEVQKIIPYMGTSSSGADGLDLETLTRVMAARDAEVKELEASLSNIDDTLSAKDRRIADLNSELDLAIREVRHRQLDLEFQQLKLEETVHSNAEMEQAQKSLVAQVGEAGLNAKHAALDMEVGRMTGMVRMQGSLPWTVRKQRLSPSLGMY